MILTNCYPSWLLGGKGSLRSTTRLRAELLITMKQAVKRITSFNERPTELFRTKKKCELEKKNEGGFRLKYQEAELEQQQNQFKIEHLKVKYWLR